MSYNVYEDRYYEFVVETGLSLINPNEIVYAIAPNAADAALITKTWSGGDIAVDGTTFTVTINAMDTVNFSGHYYHEAKFTDSQGQESTIEMKESLYFKRSLID